MDCHVRWFRREVMLIVARRLIIELVIVVAITATSVALAGGTTFEAATISLFVVPVYPVVRVTAALLLNPTSYTYVNRWVRPAGELTVEPPTATGTTTDLALAATGFSPAGSFSEWGGARTNIYANSQNDTLAITSSVDDVIVLTGLADGRTCVTTRHLIPPHSRLIVNHKPGAAVGELVEEHAALVSGLLRSEQLDHVALELNAIPELLLIEWESWQQIGPAVGPFVDVEHRRQPTLLRARVDAANILAQGRRTLPARLAMPAVDPARTLEPVVSPAEPTPEPPATVQTGAEPIVTVEPGAEPIPEPSVQPAPSTSRLSELRAQAQLAAEQTDRALAAGGR